MSLTQIDFTKYHNKYVLKDKVLALRLQNKFNKRPSANMKVYEGTNLYNKQEISLVLDP